MLTGNAVQNEEIAAAIGRQQELARFPVEGRVRQNGGLGRIPIVRFVGRGLKVPSHLSAIDVYRDDRTGKEILSGAGTRRKYRIRIAGSEIIEMQAGIVTAGYPHIATAMTGSIEIGPR